jgi:endo-1,4-beta-xylanase
MVSGNQVSATGAGTVVVRATITNGASATTPYTQNFNINVTAAAPAFVPVTNITLANSTTTAGTSLTLSGTVAPSNATNKTITWSLVGTGTTAAGATVSGNQVSATGAGTVVVRATIANGATATTPYTQTFNITVNAAAPALTVSPGSISYGAEATATSGFIITSNVSWTISSDQSWCTIQQNVYSGSGNRTLFVVVTANPSTTAQRTAVITISGGGITRTVNVTQRVAVVPSIASSSSPPAGKVGTPYRYQFIASFGTPPLIWDIPDDPPPGLTMSTSGVLSGTPTKAGTYTFHVFIQNAVGLSPEKQFTVTIAP